MNEEVAIIQILSTEFGVTGLGDDSKLYVWNNNIKKWSEV